jgi:hypothetical protein
MIGSGNFTFYELVEAVWESCGLIFTMWKNCNLDYMASPLRACVCVHNIVCSLPGTAGMEGTLCGINEINSSWPLSAFKVNSSALVGTGEQR